MKTFLKKLSLVLFPLILLIISGCASKDNLFTLTSSKGSIVFIRPTDFSVKNSEIKKLSIDFTIPLTDLKISETSTVNWTITFSEINNTYENTFLDFSFLNSDSDIKIQNMEILYKNLNKQKNLEVRYTGKLTSENMKLLLENADSAAININTKLQTVSLSSQEFSEKLLEAGIISL